MQWYLLSLKIEKNAFFSLFLLKLGVIMNKK